MLLPVLLRLLLLLLALTMGSIWTLPAAAAAARPLFCSWLSQHVTT
jgi:hypothetical protein